MDGSEALPLLVIVGPTAVGKTAQALDLAERFKGEIISADSRQLYRGMDIGTAKPSLSDRARIPHHLIDTLAPDELFTVAEFQRLAHLAIDAIHGRGNLPILVGGTGQYIQAVVSGWSIPVRAPSQALRVELEAFAQIYGPAALFDRLKAVDAAAASTIDYRNVRRVARALEVFIQSGQAFSTLQKQSAPRYRILTLGLTMSRASLYARIDARIDHMMESGLADEVESLVSAGYGWELPATSALDYRQIRAYLDGNNSLEDAASKIKHDTRGFVRKQYNWFRLTDTSITWYDMEVASPQMIATQVQSWIERVD
jgi:tRNA dimethylallyltransferase